MKFVIPKGSMTVKTPKPMKVISTVLETGGLLYPNMVRVEEHPYHLSIANALHADLTIECKPKNLIERILK